MYVRLSLSLFSLFLLFLFLFFLSWGCRGTLSCYYYVFTRLSSVRLPIRCFGQAKEKGFISKGVARLCYFFSVSTVYCLVYNRKVSIDWKLGWRWVAKQFAELAVGRFDFSLIFKNCGCCTLGSKLFRALHV